MVREEPTPPWVSGTLESLSSQHFQRGSFSRGLPKCGEAILDGTQNTRLDMVSQSHVSQAVRCSKRILAIV